MTGGRRLARPLHAAITRGKDDAAFPKQPAPLDISKHDPHQTGIGIRAFEKYTLPTKTSVLSFQQVGPRFVIRFQFVYVALCYQPANFFVRKVNVAQIVFGQRVEFAPGLSAVDCLQERAATAGNPAAVLIEKVNPVQPGHRARGLTSPACGGGSWQKAEGRKQKAEGSRQKAAERRYIYGSGHLDLSSFV